MSVEFVVARVFAASGDAERALDALDENLVRDAAVVTRTAAGHVDIRQTRQSSVGEGAVTGGTIGLLAGLLIAAPVAAAAGGLLAGGGWGARDTGIDDDRLRELGKRLQPGEAVLCVLVAEEAAAAADETLAGYGGVDAVP